MGKQEVWKKMANVLDLKTEPVPGKCLVEIVADYSVLIENHCGILSYNTEKITVKTKTGCICVCGCNLILTKMTREQLKIVGVIRNVELQGRR